MHKNRHMHIKEQGILRECALLSLDFYGRKLDHMGNVRIGRNQRKHLQRALILYWFIFVIEVKFHFRFHFLQTWLQASIEDRV